MPDAEHTLLPDEKILELALLFEREDVPYAFGGALALVYWGEPRGTVDIDTNIFLPASEAPRLFAALRQIGVTASEAAEREVAGTDQVRLTWDGTPVDLFFAYDPLHDSCRERSVVVDFFDQPIRVLSAEDIVIFKALYNRPKDWLDIEQVLAIQGNRFDAGYVRTWIGRILPRSDGARRRLDQLLDRPSSPGD